MKINKFFFIMFLFILIIPKKSFSAEKNEQFEGKGGRDDISFLNPKNSNFKKGRDALKQAFKYEKKNKIKKANQKYEKALTYFISAYKKAPENIEIINLLGLTYFKIGDFIMTEIYYREALEIDPNNTLINQKLGELYFITKRVNLAKERLNILSSCNCQEYSNLKKIISNN